MSKKYVIVGGVAGGASVAARLRRLDEHAQIVMFEKGPNVSFSNCCLPYRLSEKIKAHDDLVLMSPTQFKNQYNIIAKTNSLVTEINRVKKCVTVKNLETQEEYTEDYDILILSPGANAVVPKLEGHENAQVFIVKNVVDIAKLYDFIKANGVTKVTVVGGGFIGIETAENLTESGVQVSLVEALPQVMRIFDNDMVQILHKEMSDKGIQLYLGQRAVKYQGTNLVLENGTVVESEAVVMAIGVTPDNVLATSCGLETTERGHIKVTANYQTTCDNSIYAVGDAVEVTNAITHKPMGLPLAGPAQKQARQAADHICGKVVANTGYIGSSCIKIFDYNAAATGLTEAQAKEAGLDADIVYIIPQDKVGIMPGSVPMHFKIIYEVPTGRILGAQAISKGEAVKRIDVVATLIKFNATLDDMRDLELCYAPPFSTAKDPTNMSALVGMNLLSDNFKQIRVDEIRLLAESGACIIDVREEHEYNFAHIKGAKNVPLSRIRQCLDQIPTDVPVYLHCRSAQRSYNACLALQAHGYTNVYNVSGGFLGLSFYEYYNDKALGREPIVTDYNFN